jgi:uncharacterized protein (TIGR02246 family)
MPRPKLPPAVLHASPDDVEAQFYEALQQGDIHRLMGVWADEDEVVCVHPGGSRVIGQVAIRASFEAIFSHGAVRATPEHVHRLHALGMAVHHLVERITVTTDEGVQTGWVLATNVYLKTSMGWRMAAHHASPGSPHEVPAQGDAPSMLH